jgi:hypothetical protein
MDQRHGMTKTQREAEIAALEKKYPRKFLENSLAGDAMWWRTLTAPNTIAMDKPDSESCNLCDDPDCDGNHPG